MQAFPKPLACVGVLAILLALLLVSGGQPAHAVGFTVDSTADVVDASPGDGVCATAGGACTLRAAIMEANALAGADIITLPAGTYTLTISGAGDSGGDLDITADLTITGAGQATTVVDGDGAFRVFRVLSGNTVDIAGVTIQNGIPLPDGRGGGIINEAGAVTLTDSTVSGNRATGGRSCGGIYNNGAASLTLIRSTVSGNAGGGGSSGGGICNFPNNGTVTLIDSTVSDNTAHVGGGIWNNNGTLTLTNSTVSGNTATYGGAIWNTNNGTVTLTNSTVSSNTTTGSFGGGGILNGGVGFAAGTVMLTNSTVSGNTATIGGGISNFGTVTIKNTIVANSTSGDDCAGVITVEGNNFVESPGACVIVGSGTFNGGFDPLLGPLADNGGPTQTHALLAGSPAIDAGSPDCPPPATDQRGVARPQGAACDIGSVELKVDLEVAIDIKPGSDPNCFNIDGRGVVPVAILGSDGSGLFDALDVTQIDASSLDLEGLGVATKGKKNKLMAHVDDVSGDLIDDFVVQFEDDLADWTGGGATATLTGELYDGTPIEGTDSICIVP